MGNVLTIREMEHRDIELITNYWMNATPSHLLRMGVDVQKIPSRELFSEFLITQINTPISERLSYCIIWDFNAKPVGHLNTNPTSFGESAYMHLHLWENKKRKKGLGTDFVKLALPFLFKNLQLKTLYCQPYALNPAPNKTLEKIGFKLLKEHVTIPGSFNFEQPVKLWEMSLEILRCIS